MTIYNLTAVDATNSTYEFVKAVNSISTPEGLYFTIICYVLMIVIFTIVKVTLEQDNGVALFTSCLITTFIGILFVFSNLVTWYSLSFIYLGLVAGIIMVATVRN